MMFKSILDELLLLGSLSKDEADMILNLPYSKITYEEWSQLKHILIDENVSKQEKKDLIRKRIEEFIKNRQE